MSRRPYDSRAFVLHNSTSSIGNLVAVRCKTGQESHAFCDSLDTGTLQRHIMTFFFQNDPRHNPLISKCPHPLVEGGTLMSIKSFHNASQAFQYALTHSIFPQRIHNALNAFYRSSLPSPMRSSHLQSPPFLFNAQCTFHHILPHINILTIPYHM